MSRIELIAITRELQETLHSGDAAFEQRFAARVGSSLESAREVTGMMLRMPPAEFPWIGYLTVNSSSREVIGTCAFKSAPRDGEVEIAYFTFEPFEGRGYATEMADALVQIAERSGVVSCVLAHTLPEVNASTRVLSKAGLQNLGEVIDPEDGVVWRWQRNVPASHAAIGDPQPAS